MAPSDKHSRTEAPTPKRRKEAKSKGQVARSPDVGSWGSLLIATEILPTIFSDARATVLGVLAQCVNVMSHPSPAGALDVLTIGLRAAFEIIVPIAATFMVIGVVLSVGQTGRIFTLKSLRPRFDRLNPVSGVKRLFSPQTSVTLAKQTAKLLVLGAFAYQTVHSLVHVVPTTVPLGIAQSIGLGTSTILGFVRTVALLGLSIGIGDYAYQRHHLLQSLKMTKQEVKDEARQADGDPVMKGELRKRMYQISRSRVLAAVRTADVVIANPTHFSVALQYAPGSTRAPKVVAKGSDALALRMREEASTCQIPVVEDPPLARYLYANCEMGETIPVEIYLAVARLLAFVYSLPTYVRSGMTLHPAHSLVPEDPGAQTAARARMNPRVRARLSQAA